MNFIRYFNAFLLSSLTFVLIYFIFMALPKAEKVIKPAPSQVMKIALVTPIKKVVKPVAKEMPKSTSVPLVPPIIAPIKKETKKIVKKRVIKKVKPKKVIKKKIVKKKIIKKKVIKKIKPKKVIQKKIAKKRVEPKEIVTEPIETYIPPPEPVYVAPPVVQQQPQKIYTTAPEPVLKPVAQAPAPVAKNDYHKKAFLRNVRSKIIANKTYPKIAKRRHIEGSVKVRFDITASGDVTNIRFINGKRIFQKSIRATLERTFPMGIPPEVLGELPISDVSVVLHFNIR